MSQGASNASVRLVAAVLTLLSLALGWRVGADMAARIDRPFSGFLTFHNGLVAPSFYADPDVGRAGVRYMDRVVAVDGHAVGGGRDIQAHVEASGAGAPIRYTFERGGTERFEATFIARPFDRRRFYSLVLPFLLGGLLMLGVGILPALLRPDRRDARLFSFAFWAFVTQFCFLNFDYFVGYRFVPYSYVINVLAKGSLLHLALTFPERRWPLTRRRTPVLASIYGLLALQSSAFVWLSYRAPHHNVYLDRLHHVTFLGTLLMLSGNSLATALRSTDPVLRQRARVVLLGPVVLVVAVTALLATGLHFVPMRPTATHFVLMGWAFPIVMAYAILSQNVFEIGALIRQRLALAVLALSALAAFLGTFATVERLAGAGPAWVAALSAAVVASAVIAATATLRQRLGELLERVLFPEYRRRVAVVLDAGERIARESDRNVVARSLRAALAEVTTARSSRLLIATGAGLMEVGPAQADDALTLESRDPLVQLLSRPRLVDLDGSGAPNMASSRRLDALGARLLVPLPPLDGVNGAMFVGARSDGRMYTSDDIRLVQTLAAHVAASLAGAHARRELADIRSELEKRTRVVALCDDVGDDGLVGTSAAIRDVRSQVARVATTHANVLVLGETGAGKEVVSQAIHHRSGRKGSLVKVACGAIPETLLESELFGHERGAFTGAVGARTGRFEEAHRGTLLLDDVDTLPLSLQVKLLRVLQEGEVQRLGGGPSRRIDVRVIATSNQDLEALSRAGRFREDLFYRLNVIPIRLPPLRERLEDIAPLTAHLLARAAERVGRAPPPIRAAFLEQLRRHAWPGNVRELGNVIEREMVMNPGELVALSEPLGRAPRASAGVAPDGKPLAELVRGFKRQLIERALAESGGNQRRAAELLGMHRPSLSRMMRSLGMGSPPRASTRPR
jgi:transcriptional regulator with GAF, ATPase, and Fis domain